MKFERDIKPYGDDFRSIRSVEAICKSIERIVGKFGVVYSSNGAKKQWSLFRKGNIARLCFKVPLYNHNGSKRLLPIIIEHNSYNNFESNGSRILETLMAIEKIAKKIITDKQGELTENDILLLFLQFIDKRAINLDLQLEYADMAFPDLLLPERILEKK